MPCTPTLFARGNQLRHSHATELFNGGACVMTVRKRLGKKSLQTTLLYAELFDARAGEEMRAAAQRSCHHHAGVSATGEQSIPASASSSRTQSVNSHRVPRSPLVPGLD